MAAGAEWVQAAALRSVQVVQHHSRGMLGPPKGIELVVPELYKSRSQKQHQEKVAAAAAVHVKKIKHSTCHDYMRINRGKRP